jgi:hypothetical protein
MSKGIPFAGGHVRGPQIIREADITDARLFRKSELAARSVRSPAARYEQAFDRCNDLFSARRLAD